MTKNFIKEKMGCSQAVLGPFLKMSDPSLIEQAGLAGFDFVIIDMEHGPASFETAQDLIRAAELRGVSPIVRTSDASEINILRVLDIGAHGVQVPQVSTPELAEEVVKAAKFFPEGHRGVCRYTRSADYTYTEKSEHFRRANAETMVIIHIEGIEGVNNLEKILEVEGLDVIFLGPYDLSQSCGVPGDTTNPIVVDKMKYAVELARRKGVKVGTFVETPEGAKFWREQGVGYLSYSVDVGIYYNACKAIVESVKH